jgi:single-strand DNA-binding protein
MVRQIRGTVNYVELIGWVGDEPEQRILASGATMCTFRVATKRIGPRDATGERTFDTDWIAVETWDRLAALCLRSLHKGSRMRVIGSLHNQTWEDKETGQRRHKTVVRAEEVMFFDSRIPSNHAPPQEEPLEESEEAENISY